MIRSFQVLLFFVLVFRAFYLPAQQSENKEKADYKNSCLFNSITPIDIEIYVNKKDLLQDIGDDQAYHHTLIKYTDSLGVINELNFKISTRGHFRKDPANCKLPPLKLKIPKEVSQSDNLFEGQNKIKLVLPCFAENKKYSECLVLEYLTYKTYELFTENSYKTRLVNIVIADSANKKNKQNVMGFFLEETDQMAQRNKGKVIKFKRFHPENVDRNQMTMLAVFQFMVGNTDWSVDVQHNIDLLFIENQTTPVAVPFDFDWSGIVDAPYAIPQPNLNIISVKERLFRGYERSAEEFTPVIKLFNDKKEEIYQLYKNCNWLSEKTRNNTIKYLDDFYEVINDPKKVQKEFINNCRKL
ncbi:MAG: hypothetical protein U0W24_03270 [Bacteroidales bacterium]